MTDSVMSLLPGKKVPKREISSSHHQQQQQQQQQHRPPHQASVVTQFASPQSPSDHSSSFHLPANGIFRIIAVPDANDPSAPPLFQIVPHVRRADRQLQQSQSQSSYSSAHSHPFQTDFGKDEPWRLESYWKIKNCKIKKIPPPHLIPIEKVPKISIVHYTYCAILLVSLRYLIINICYIFLR